MPNSDGRLKKLAGALPVDPLREAQQRAIAERLGVRWPIGSVTDASPVRWGSRGTPNGRLTGFNTGRESPLLSPHLPERRPSDFADGASMSAGHNAAVRLQRFHVYRLPDGRKVSADRLYAPGSLGARPIGWVLLLARTGWLQVHPDGRITEGNGEHTGWRTEQLKDLGRLAECQQCDTYAFALCAHRGAA